MVNTERGQRILDEITRFYLESEDFNGIPVLSGLTANLGLGWNALIDDLRQLIAEGKVCVIYSDTDINPHIMRVAYEAADAQIEKLETIDVHACAYPLPKHLEQVVDHSQYAGRPYALAMALGNAQLSHRAFDLSVLEFYRNDPRYNYTNDDIDGRIYLSDEYYESEGMAESDKVFLQTFGFCYDEELNRAVAVFLRYLSDLSPEHQQIWKAKELEGDYQLHPDYYRNAIIGDFGEGVSVFDAFIEELQVINRMAQAIGRPPLFRNDFSQEPKPIGFSFLIRPTLKEFNDFVLLLDKMISDNISKDFFQGEVAYESEEVRRDGKIVVRQKGTLAILDEWIHKRFRIEDWEPIDQMSKVFREVRRRRQHPAHAIDENMFSQAYFREQRELITRAYDGIRTLRLLLANHPGADEVEVLRVVQDGKIWTR
jgi:hypothetical protein